MTTSDGSAPGHHPVVGEALAGGRPVHTAPATLVVPQRRGRRPLLRPILAATTRFRSPNLEQLAILHFGEWSLHRPRADTLPERHLAGCLLFLSDFDGDMADYIMAFARGPRLTFRLLFGGSVSYPGARNSGLLLSYVQRFYHPSIYYYSAYPTATLRDVRRALALEPGIEELLDAADDASFEERFRALRRDQLQHGARGAPGGPGARWALPTRQGPPTTGTFTCLVPLRPGRVTMAAAELNRCQRRLPAAFDAVPGTHFARFSVVSGIFDGQNRLLPADPSYLLFSAQFDLPPEPLPPVAGAGRRRYVATMCRELARAHPALAAVWRHGEDAPADPAGRALARYLLDHRVRPGLFVTALPEHLQPAPVTRIRRALARAAVLDRFVADTRRWPARARRDELHRRLGAGREPRVGSDHRPRPDPDGERRHRCGNGDGPC